MILDLVYVVAGLIVLILAGEALVRGAVNLALRLGIPALVIGLTVVSFGTSAPELLVSIQAVLKDQAGIALGNVVGSNIANVLLVLGLPAVISMVHADGDDTRRSYAIMLASTVVFIGMAFFGPLTVWHGLVLLAGLGFMLFDNYLCARRFRRASLALVEENGAEAELEGADPAMPGWKIAGFLAFGLIGLPVGADLLVDGSVEIARALGVSETVIGLTLVAVGTSLPELVTTTIAALRREAGVALGNVIGSNTFNLLAIVGIAVFFGDMAVPDVLLSRDLWVMLGAALLLLPLVMLRRPITRIAGVGFLAAYGLYLFAVVAAG